MHQEDWKAEIQYIYCEGNVKEMTKNQKCTHSNLITANNLHVLDQFTSFSHCSSTEMGD